MSGQLLIEFGFIKKQLLESFDIYQEVLYAEIAKQEGLLRCSTLPLIRD